MSPKDLEAYRFAHSHTAQAVGQKPFHLSGMCATVQVHGTWLHTSQFPHPSKDASAVQYASSPSRKCQWFLDSEVQKNAARF